MGLRPSRCNVKVASHCPLRIRMAALFASVLENPTLPFVVAVKILELD
jgi:hypothetical protein